MAETKRKCKCGCARIVKGHPNKKFFSKRHKDNYWNRVNPRGIALRGYGGADPYSIEPEDIEDSMHPHDSYSLGQD